MTIFKRGTHVAVKTDTHPLYSLTPEERPVSIKQYKVFNLFYS